MLRIKNLIRKGGEKEEIIKILKIKDLGNKKP